MPSEANGLTFCTGSLRGVDNDVPAMAKRFAGHIKFAHLRNVSKEPDGSFMEADHLGGDVDMVSVVTTLLEEQKRRHDAGDANWRIPFRPDHGHELLDDVGKDPPRLPGHRPAARSGRNPRRHDRRRQPAANAGLKPEQDAIKEKEE